MPADLAAAVQLLSQSEDFVILRRLTRVDEYHPPDDEPKRIALFVDVETTGLHPQSDRIIQYSGVPFEYSPATGRICRILPAVEYFEDPGRPIPPVIVAKTGINNQMVAGKRLDDEAIVASLSDVALVIAHNAVFDRRFLERRIPAFAEKCWACSQTEVPWPSNGYDSVKLEYLVYKHTRTFYSAHRADEDCYAAIHLLATPLPDGRYPLHQLLESARRTSVRIWASNSPFATKDALRTRGYRWAGDETGPKRAWWKDLREADVEAELSWLRTEVYGSDEARPTVCTVDARNRFSERL
jgi:DNA polymerase III subunit epsilon